MKTYMYIGVMLDTAYLTLLNHTTLRLRLKC